MSEEVHRAPPGAAEIMLRFADETGLSSDRPPRRYLWTDAFAVCNFLALHDQTGDDRYLSLAVKLVHQGHDILGRHRDDDPRTGWLSGLSGAEAQRHPTVGGLRIGKPRAERAPGQPPDEEAEWDRDGQYYHYLSKWLHALNRTGQVTGDAEFCRWAFELAQTMHQRFVHSGPGGRPHLVWKMSIDLTRALVPSSGQHDALDGLATYGELQTTVPESADWADLRSQIAELTAMCEDAQWVTPDPLGAGMLLADTYRLAQLMAASDPWAEMFERLLDDSASSLEAVRASGALALRADRRLAFRELGLAIGLRALAPLWALVESSPGSTRWRNAIADLRHHERLADDLVAFWRQPSNQRWESWTAHLDINRVMLATALVPDTFLHIG